MCECPYYNLNAKISIIFKICNYFNKIIYIFLYIAPQLLFLIDN